MGQDESKAIVMDRVSRTFRDFWRRPRNQALREVSLDVRLGEVFGLLGPNGSGKTTALKIIAGLLRPTSGTLTVLGHPPGHRDALARMGYLPEDPAHYGFLSAVESLEFYGKLFGMGLEERRARARELVEALDMESFGSRPVRVYSRGMAQRLGIAQALVNRPELLVLDEPTSGLDPLAHHKVKDLLCRLRDEGRSILISSHLLSDVEDICDRIGILAKGRLLLQGPVEDLLTEEGAVECRIEGVAAERVSEAIGEMGGEVVSCRIPRGALDDLFLKAVREDRGDEGDPGDRGGDPPGDAP
jgi:ABC-2 type transport system ATP-binding protein